MNIPDPVRRLRAACVAAVAAKAKVARMATPQALRLRAMRLALAGAAAALVLAACGGGGDDPSRAGAPQTPAVAAASDAPAEAGFASRKNLPAFDPAAPGSQFTGNGWYWNAAEPGTGMMFEAQGHRGFLAVFLYGDDGQPTWFTGEGSFSKTDWGYWFQGEARRFTGGMAAGASQYTAPTATVIGTIGFAIAPGAGRQWGGTVSLPGGRQWQVGRFDFGGLDFPASPTQPEVGWFWNPQQSGRGWALEMQGGALFGAMFHYRPDGQPTWNTIEAYAPYSVIHGNAWKSHSGGQTLTGPYRAPTAGAPQQMSMSFSHTCKGSFVLPGETVGTHVQRFAFGVADPCRNAYRVVPSNQQVRTTTAAYPSISRERAAWNYINGELARCGFPMLQHDPRIDAAAVVNTDSRARTELSVGSGFLTDAQRLQSHGYNAAGADSEFVRDWNFAAALFTIPNNLFRISYNDIGLSFQVHQGRPIMGVFLGREHNAQWKGPDQYEQFNDIKPFPCEGSSGLNPREPETLTSRDRAWNNAWFNDGPWGQPIIVRGPIGGDGTWFQVDSISITGPRGPVRILQLWNGRHGPHAMCVYGQACAIPERLDWDSEYTVHLKGEFFIKGHTPSIRDRSGHFERTFRFKTARQGYTGL